MLVWIVLIIFFILISLRIINEYERGVLFTFGKYSGILNPGLRIVIPFVQRLVKVGLRTVVIDVPYQEAITKDNIPTKINAVVYYRVVDPKKAILEVEDYHYAVSQVAQTTMRNIIGEVELDELLANRQKIANKIEKIVDEATDAWGIKIEIVDLKDIQIPDNMKRLIARQAEAEREKRATIIKSEGDVIAAHNLKKAAKILSEEVGAMHLRTLQTLADISADPNTKIIFVLPTEILKLIDKNESKK